MSDILLRPIIAMQVAVHQLREREDGQTTTEYAILLGFLAIAIIVALFFLRNVLRSLFSSRGQLRFAGSELEPDDRYDLERPAPAGRSAFPATLAADRLVATHPSAGCREPSSRRTCVSPPSQTGAPVTGGRAPLRPERNLHMSDILLRPIIAMQVAVHQLREREDGQTTTEYAILLGFLAIAIIVALFFLRNVLRSLFSSAASSVSRAPG